MTAKQIQARIRKGLTFSKNEIDAAVRDMLSRKAYISNHAKDGIAIGLSQKPLVDQCVVSAYADGFWLAPLTIHLNGSGTLDKISVAPILLLTVNTEFAEMGKRLAAKQSAVHLDDRESEESGLGLEINALKKRMADAGMVSH